MIRYIPYESIDKAKWDACILEAANGNIYATSSWLDSWCKWDALVLGDYEVVMPLPIKQIGFIITIAIGISRQPLFTQQLGVFGNDASTRLSMTYNELITEFLNKIPLGVLGKIYKLHLYLNVANPLESIPQKFKPKPRITHHLALAAGNKGYNENTKRSIKKALAAALTARHESESPDAILDFLVSNSEKIETVKPRHWQQYKQAIQTQWKLGQVQTWETLDPEGNRQAAAIFLVYKNVAVYSLGASTLAGRDTGAMHLLMDTFICHNLSRLSGAEPSRSATTLDFAGSMIPSIARFFKSWGAVEVRYAEIRW